MKKLFMVLGACLLLVGCGTDKAKDAVISYLNQYNNLGDTVTTDLNTLVDSENLTDSQKEVYKEVLEKQYKDLSYDIVNEEYNGDEAIVTVKVKVYDLYKAQNDAATYLSNHSNEFNDDNGTYDNDLYIDYKLEQMKNMTDTVEYTINFNVVKEDGKWKVVQPSNDDLEKIHGIYNYEIES